MLKCAQVTREMHADCTILGDAMFGTFFSSAQHVFDASNATHILNVTELELNLGAQKGA